MAFERIQEKKRQSKLKTWGTLLVLAAFAGSALFNFFPEEAFSAVNKQINYQGKLTLSSSSQAVSNASYNMRFKLYTAATGGSPIWTETWCYSTNSGSSCTGSGTDSRVSVGSGLFSIMLGSTTPFTGVDFNQTLYLGVEIGGSASTPSWDGEMTPRKILGAVPAALVADTLDNLDSGQFFRSDTQNSTSSTSTFLNLVQNGAGKIAEFFGPSSSSAFSVLANGNVGIGTSTPLSKLDIAGGVAIGTYAALNVAPSNGVIVSGNVGIGTTSPFSKLSIDSSGATAIALRSTGTGGRGYRIVAGDSSVSSLGIGAKLAILDDSAGTLVRLVIDSTGNIGIGTTSPTQRLSVAGDISGNNIIGSYFTATSSTASQFPYASTTALTVSATNGLQLASGLNGPLQANAGLVSATSSVGPLYGGTGQTSYVTGDLLYSSATNVLSKRAIGSTGNILSVVGGVPSWVATSTLGLGTQWTTTGSDIYYATGNVGIGTTSPFAKLSVGGSAYIGGNLTATGTLAVSGATTLASASATSLSIGSLTGPLQAVSGTVSASSTISSVFGGTGFSTYTTGDLLYSSATNVLSKRAIGSTGNILSVSSGVPTWVGTSTLGIAISDTTGTLAVSRGGTGLSTTPSYGQVLVGNGSGYTLTATSSLGLGGVGSGTAGQFPFYESSGTTLTATSTLFLTTEGRIAVGKNTADYKFDTQGTGKFQGGQDSIGVGSYNSPSPQSGSSSYNMGDSLNYRAYAWKVIGGTRYYSASYAEMGEQFISNNGDTMGVSFNAPAGADGVRTLRDYNTNGFIDYRDQGSFTDDGSGWTSGSTVTPTTDSYSLLAGYDDGATKWSAYGDSNAYFAGSLGVGSGATVPSNTLTVTGTGGRFTGSYTEDTTNTGVHLGIVATPRIGFFNGTAAQNWQIDNSAGAFRWFLPGVVHMSLTTAGLSLPDATSGVVKADGTGINYFRGSLGVGTTSPFAKLSVGGSAYIGGNLTATGTLAVSGATTLASASATSLSIGSLTGPLQAVSGTVSASSTISSVFGGTGFSTYTTGDLLYSSATNVLSKRAIGSTGDVLSVVGGIPSWVATSSLGITGGSSQWTTSGSDIYYSNGSGNVGVGTTSPFSDLSIDSSGATAIALRSTGTGGRAYRIIAGDSSVSSMGIGAKFAIHDDSVLGGATRLVIDSSGNIGIGTTSPAQRLSVAGDISGNNIFGSYFTATSTTASVFPYASTTALTISGTGGLQLATGLNGPLQANDGLVSATTSVGTIFGGTGLTSYTLGDLLYSSATNVLSKRAIGSTGDVLSVVGGVPDWVATSTLGIVGGSGTNYFTSSGANTFLNTGTNLQAPTVNATSSAATSTFIGGIEVATTTGPGFRVDRTTGNVKIGNGSPSENTAPFSVERSTGTEVRLGMFNTTVATQRSEFTVSNSATTNWTTNFCSMMVHGGSYAGANYLGSAVSDAGLAMFNCQGSVLTGLAFNTFTADPIIFGTTDTPRMQITSGGNVAIGGTTSALPTATSLFNVGNTAQFQVTSAGLVLGPAGSFAGPTYAAVSDPNTGMNLLGSDILQLITGGAERMKILANGNLGVGTSTPFGVLSVGTHNLPIASPSFVIASSSTGVATSTQFIVVNGRAGVGTTSPWRTLGVTGTVGFDGLTASTGAGSLCLSSSKEIVYNAASDACLSSLRDTKHDITSLNFDSLSLIRSLEPVSFVYNDSDGRVRYGFIAEDASLVDPHFGTYNANGEISGIDDRALVAALTKAVQELDMKIDLLSGTSSPAFGAEGGSSTFKTFKDWMEGKITAFIGIFKRVETKKLCVGETCVTEDEFKALLDNAGVDSVPRLDPTASPDPTPEITPTPTPTPDVGATPTPTPDNEPSPTPTPEIGGGGEENEPEPTPSIEEEGTEISSSEETSQNEETQEESEESESEEDSEEGEDTSTSEPSQDEGGESSTS